MKSPICIGHKNQTTSFRIVGLMLVIAPLWLLLAPGLGTCTHPPYGGTGQIICHEGDGMAPNTTWTVRLTVKVTAAAGSTITANAATMADTPDPNMANNMATVSLKVQ